MLCSEKLKIVLLSAANSIHTIRWANGLHKFGHEVHVISQHSCCEPLDNEIILHKLPFYGALGYFIMIGKVRKLINKIKPDIVNAHYASGYGTTARLVGYKPWLLSVWGSDVYDFPYKSLLHKDLLKKNLYAADAVASTSHCMAEQTKSIAPQLSNVHITAFGVDLEKFKPIAVKRPFEDEAVIIGTVKSLSDKYGIEYLIRAFKIVNDKYPNLLLRLLIVGGGNLEEYLKKLVIQLNINNQTIFTGRVHHQDVPIYQNMLDISVSVSNSESFGVAIIEASACAKPVVVSNVGGLLEVVENGVTGIIVPPRNPEATADAIEKLLLNRILRENMGQAGRRRVEQLYDWDNNVQHMINVYESLLKTT